MSPEIAVIGAGAAGLTAAGFAAQSGARVTVFEKNDRPGVKLRITGKGRCNVTNACTRQEFFDNVISNPKFLYSAYSGFDPDAVMEFFEGLGVPLKVERGRRVFPQSDKAADIVNALYAFCLANKVNFLYENVTIIEKGEKFNIYTKTGSKTFDKIIIASGGCSYRATGSSGDGYVFAKRFGHTVVPPQPSLVPLVCSDSLCRECAGLSLKNVELKLTDTQTGKTLFCEMGEMLFTHIGVSGPLVLSASAQMSDVTPGKYRLSIDLKPALDEKTLDRRLLSDFSENLNRNFANSLSALLPSKLIAPVVERSGIPPEEKVNSITSRQRASLLSTLKSLELNVVSKGDMNEAIITRGGVSTREINPKTMESKLVPGLYFAGEIIDVDALTGGYNLQIAFCTAHSAAISAAED